MQAISHLRCLLDNPSHAEAVRAFLAEKPLDGEAVLAKRIEDLHTKTRNGAVKATLWVEQDDTLSELLDTIKERPPMTPEEVFEQKVSWCYSMQNRAVSLSKEDVRTILRNQLAGGSPHQNPSMRER